MIAREADKERAEAVAHHEHAVLPTVDRAIGPRSELARAKIGDKVDFGPCGKSYQSHCKRRELQPEKIKQQDSEGGDDER